ncbi:nitrous oxide reductase accessory protein NosL [Thalassolituus alkanivorans]|mgnify:FL=1|jgi:copper chaperone NosL|uniref:nitrous oxide reductase accessory protein NosL n=1 Tax=Thalassolituus alkanivorans TaxID=2881055 RepID=UPI001E2EC2C6|nr:nitrous oxide reductase accessory protein NosL [Thalassolituus alkanivorans]MCB2388029.1 nitrous oxide reductase accessory protein NosL [Thalassolituus alkanivorans]MCB2424551.1 nitrous oxide reductase accessory protein NosL [Thalassolituus alkanivorans]
MKKVHSIISVAALIFSALLAGCSQPTNSETTTHSPVAFHSSDECHVCGMAITRFPGPKGEAISGNGATRKFCSSAEMLHWWLQPENQVQKMTLYVHDMSRSDWNRPDDAHLINAMQAFYVVAPDMAGSMGTPIASFANKESAALFASDRQTSVMTFEQLKEALLQHQQMMGENHSEDHSMHH